ncbi:hypothetical protein [uncultured Winogradskyella sp.]|uniref:hypothetical protein n=1 Tax=uncultured Winogradskyella sp. TaxID=395353 RepID=UPI00260C96D8|nr:hypothetical protein [uncultured Winogradskyella sp.]
MKFKVNSALPCAVFGHNYIKSKMNADQTSELTCSHCKTVANTDPFGNFIETSSPSKDVQSTLRKLYHLSLRTRQFKVAELQ